MMHYESQWWHKIIRRLSLIIALKSAIVVLVCYQIGYEFSKAYGYHLSQVAGLWCAISGILVLQVLIKESLSAGGLRVLGSLIGSITAYIFASLLGYSLTSLATCLFFTVILVSLLNIKPSFRLACLTAAIVIVIGMVTPQLHPFANSFSRFIESTLGSVIAIIITAIFYPIRKKYNLLSH